MATKRLNPKNFTNYNENKKEVESKILLFVERIPNPKEFEHDGQRYLLENSQNIYLTGAITDPPKTISRSLFNSYEWVHLKASLCDGWLFEYEGFAPGSVSDHKQLNFKVYELKKV